MAVFYKVGRGLKNAEHGHSGDAPRKPALYFKTLSIIAPPRLLIQKPLVNNVQVSSFRLAPVRLALEVKPSQISC